VLFGDQWFALQVKIRTEHQVATILRSKGYEEFLPTHNVNKKQTADRKPLFPGYVFCRVNPMCVGLIVTTPGVLRIVKFGEKPAPIDPEEIRSIQLIADSGVPLSILQGLSVGDKVSIEDGPLRGAIGILSSIRSGRRLLVSISMMMRTVAAEVNPEWVRAVIPLQGNNVSASMYPGYAA
jgi:transcription antitermination factor NusG